MKYRIQYIILKLLFVCSGKKLSKLSPIIRKYGYLANLDRYRRQGATIGENSILINCTLSSSSKGDRFVIGKNCTLTGTTLLAHDASPSLFIDELVLKPNVYMAGSRLSYRNPIFIGDNVFLGWGTIVLPGVSIGDDVVVGAGSIVTKDIPSGSVAAGNPAKVLKQTEDYISDYRQLLAQHPERF